MDRLNFDRKLDLLVRREERHASDFLQIHLDGVVDADALRRERGFQCVDVVFRQRKRIFVVIRLVDDLDVVLLERLIQTVNQLHLETKLFQRIVDLLRCDLSVALSVFNKRDDYIFLFCHTLSPLFFCGTAFGSCLFFLERLQVFRDLVRRLSLRARALRHAVENPVDVHAHILFADGQLIVLRQNASDETDGVR